MTAGLTGLEKTRQAIVALGKAARDIGESFGELATLLRSAQKSRWLARQMRRSKARAAHGRSRGRVRR